MMIPPTPGGNRKVKLFMEKAKYFNKELQNLATKFNQIQDVAYEKQKVDLVFDMTEKSIEQSGHLAIIIERLKVLETINKESPNIEAQLQSIVKNTAKVIPEKILNENKLIKEIRDQLISAASELD